MTILASMYLTMPESCLVVKRDLELARPCRDYDRSCESCQAPPLTDTYFVFSNSVVLRSMIAAYFGFA